MTWTLENSRGNEAAKIRWNLVPYMRGRALDLGCGPYKVFPHFIGVDNGHHEQAFGIKGQADVLVDTCEKLVLIADESVDFCFNSHLIEHIPYENITGALNEWLRILRVGGHLAIYAPDEDEYPKVGERGANPDHKWNVNYDLLVSALEKTDYSWDIVEFEKRNQNDEYSIFMVIKKL